RRSPGVPERAPAAGSEPKGKRCRPPRNVKDGVAWSADSKFVAVESVAAGGAAERAGLAPADIVTAVDGRPLSSLEDYDLAARDFERGRPASFEILRDGARRSLPVTPGGDGPWLNLSIQGLAAFACLALGLIA
ncbi:MAG: PDZ domain-containing protein, partial [Acidobacteriota bacterium]